MKVLISAFACSPYGGTESYFGWSAVQCLAKDHDLWVLTSGRNRPDFDRALAEGLVPSNIRLTYANRFSEWPRNRMKAKLQNWTEYRDYSQPHLPWPGRCISQSAFDLVRPVRRRRLADYPRRYGDAGIPFVWGPIHGNEQLSLRLYNSFCPSAICFELLTSCSVHPVFPLQPLPPSGNVPARAAHIFEANPETEMFLDAKTARSGLRRVRAFTGLFSPRQKSSRLPPRQPSRDWQAPLRFFARGNAGRTQRRCPGPAVRSPG